MADDFIQLGELEGDSPCTWLGPLQLYTLSDGVRAHVRALQDAGAFPWFFGPDFKMAFFRPLSSALLAVRTTKPGFVACRVRSGDMGNT